ncbi:MAG: hypothetical protein KU37_08535 [Sulfuricurvum sp. PC08-66]|nr:MAG: hypothetical protein KU37_08535 [Sulfuricurvum sp. PC08-66]
MTLHLNLSESVSQKVFAFLESLAQKGEKVEIIDDALFQYEKKGILQGLSQIDQGKLHTSQELLAELA